ncbi:uncharacterized protein EURHEDRAFT_515703 [Aspergillus ruber CBS 135680]|uniref:Uncharacterized protein n=1 Tax=Aspergillus ruber (strain CBS 135680) TaxID=1388766 RepID=A0A017SEB7_ASPRC|nr:uncharacterized protein EURHEDRAFT_515703 [Aspergillus ruber CBS 135680]EYE94979.1 hypothetical protein EURHEDRAFT_515703 [Aspergillus ruber CBS 135680]
MTSDKQNPGHIAKPFTPALSAAFHRSNNKSPLTPRLATPGGYRTPRRVAQSEHPASANTTPSKDDYRSSASYLSTNVTPRTNSRTSRRDGPVSSPTSTTSGIPSAPHTPNSQSMVTPGSQNGAHYRTERSPVRGGPKLEAPRTSRARTLTAESHHSARPMSSPDMSSSGSPMFFHASDARSSNTPEPEPRLKPPGKPSSPASFVYANGKKDERRSSADESHPTAPTIKRRSTGLSRSVVGGKPPTTNSASPRLKTAKLAAEPAPRLSDSVISQSGPPPINDSTESSSQRQASLPAIVPDRPPPVPLSVARHIKSSSLDSASNSNSPREALRPSPIIVSPTDPQVDDSAAASEPIPGLRPRIFSNGSSGSADTASPDRDAKEQVNTNDPAANARVERKIMDLEISNSSLLAINRTLEREMRKQNAELRRYRRLSRAGRIPVGSSSRSVSGAALSTTTETEEEGMSEISSVQSHTESSDQDDDEDSADERVMSPGSLAKHDAKHRARDEKRVFIDLAKHQELLTDSQKMNQSLRRCLAWTEELIKDGQKALEYDVHVNDIELGGRVLAPEELQDIGESARGLLSASNFKDDYSSVTESSDPDSGNETA